MLKAHKQPASIRTLHLLLRSVIPKVIDRNAINRGDEVYFFYNFTKQNEYKEWRVGTIASIYDHCVDIRSQSKGPPTRASFEDKPIKSTQGLVEGLMDYSVDEIDHEGGEVL